MNFSYNKNNNKSQNFILVTPADNCETAPTGGDAWHAAGIWIGPTRYRGNCDCGTYYELNQDGHCYGEFNKQIYYFSFLS